MNLKYIHNNSDKNNYEVDGTGSNLYSLPILDCGSLSRKKTRGILLLRMNNEYATNTLFSYEHNIINSKYM